MRTFSSGLFILLYMSWNRVCRSPIIATLLEVLHGDGNNEMSSFLTILRSASSSVTAASSTLSCPISSSPGDDWIDLRKIIWDSWRNDILYGKPFGCGYRTAVSMTREWDKPRTFRSLSSEWPTMIVSEDTNFSNSFTASSCRVETCVAQHYLYL